VSEEKPEEKPVHGRVADALVDRPTTVGCYVGTVLNERTRGIDVFRDGERVELQVTLARTVLTLRESREMRALLERAEALAGS
jgi:hypothetical protein